MNNSKVLNQYNKHSKFPDWYLHDIGNVNGLIRCRLSTIPITNLIRLVMAKANISIPQYKIRNTKGDILYCIRINIETGWQY